jgi:hypothetical protein
MPDQDHPRSCVHVPVIGHVQQQLLENPTLNPVVKHGNERIKINLLGILRKEFDIYVLEVDWRGHSEA